MRKVSPESLHLPTPDLQFAEKNVAMRVVVGLFFLGSGAASVSSRSIHRGPRLVSCHLASVHILIQLFEFHAQHILRSHCICTLASRVAQSGSDHLDVAVLHTTKDASRNTPHNAHV